MHATDSDVDTDPLTHDHFTSHISYSITSIADPGWFTMLVIREPFVGGREINWAHFDNYC